jgi:hypothetical protein
MKQLLYKEFRLAMHPTMYIFPLLSVLVLIPSYPYYVAFMYICLGMYFTFLQGRETGDLYFTAMLPVRKKDIVTARVVMVCFFQWITILISLPFAVLSVGINPMGQNAAGIELNAAFYGLVLCMLGGFNLCFLPGFYKTGRKLGRPFFRGGVFIVLFIAAAEAAAQYIPSPMRDWLDVPGPALAAQWPVLLMGALGWGGLTALAWQLSVRRFERLDL